MANHLKTIYVRLVFSFLTMFGFVSAGLTQPYDTLKIAIIDFAYRSKQTQNLIKLEDYVLVRGIDRVLNLIGATGYDLSLTRVPLAQVSSRPIALEEVMSEVSEDDFDICVWGQVAPHGSLGNYNLTLIIFTTRLEPRNCKLYYDLEIRDGRIKRWNNKDCDEAEFITAFIPGIIGYMIISQDKEEREAIEKQISINLLNQVNKLERKDFFSRYSDQDCVKDFADAGLILYRFKENTYKLPIPVTLYTSIINNLANDRYEKNITIDSKSRRAVRDLSFAYKQASNIDGGIEMISEVIKQSPDSSYLYLALADLYHSENLYKDAIAQYQKAIELAPNDIEGYIFLGNVQRDSGASSNAISFYRKALEIEPKNLWAGLCLSQMYSLIGFDEKALNELKRVLADHPTSAWGYSELGNLYRKKNRKQLAILAYEKAVEIEGENTNYLLNLGYLYLEKDKYAKAIALFKAAINNSPDNPRCHIALGKTFSQIQKNDTAKTHLERALTLAQRDQNVLLDVGYIYSDLNEFDLADSLFRRVILADHNNTNARIALANLLKDHGQFEASKSELQIAKELNPEDSNVYTSLAYLYKDRGNFGKAKSYFMKAINLRPHNTSNYDGLANLFAQDGIKFTNEVGLDFYSEYFSEPINIESNITDAQLLNFNTTDSLRTIIRQGVTSATGGVLHFRMEPLSKIRLTYDKRTTSNAYLKKLFQFEDMKSESIGLYLSGDQSIWNFADIMGNIAYKKIWISSYESENPEREENEYILDLSLLPYKTRIKFNNSLSLRLNNYKNFGIEKSAQWSYKANLLYYKPRSRFELGLRYTYIIDSFHLEQSKNKLYSHSFGLFLRKELSRHLNSTFDLNFTSMFNMISNSAIFQKTNGGIIHTKTIKFNSKFDCRLIERIRGIMQFNLSRGIDFNYFDNVSLNIGAEYSMKIKMPYWSDTGKILLYNNIKIRTGLNYLHYTSLSTGLHSFNVMISFF